MGNRVSGIILRGTILFSCGFRFLSCKIPHHINILILQICKILFINLVIPTKVMYKGKAKYNNVTRSQGLRQYI